MVVYLRRLWILLSGAGLVRRLSDAFFCRFLLRPVSAITAALESLSFRLGVT
jgi:hypothetical protein